MAEITQAEKQNRKRQNLEYPLNNPDDYLGRLKFTVVKEPETDLGNMLDFVKNTVGIGAKGIKDTATEEQTTEGAVEKTKEELQKEIDTVRGNVFVTRNGPRELINTGRSVKLYMPTGLAYRDTVNYENFDLGGMGGGAEAALKGGGSVAKSIFDGGVQTLAAAFGGAANKDMASLATVKLASIAPDEIAGAFKSAGQVTSNPNTRVLFKSVNLREFAFAFKFIATSKKEAEEVKEIIKFFRTELYPENIKVPVPGGNNSISIGYRFPNKFKIEVLYRGKHIATKIKPCFLRDVNVTYNPTVSAMHDDGNFQEVEMSLMFQESRTLAREDIEGDETTGNEGGV